MKKILANKNNLLVIALIGILLLIIAIPTGKSESVISNTSTKTENKEELEERLERVLKSTEGVGNVKVMINQNDNESSFESDSKEDGDILGVVVVAEGAQDSTVKKKIQDIVLALFPIEAHKIEIVKMKSN